MSSEPVRAINVEILDKPYRVGCKDDEVDALTNAARYLDGKMRELRNAGKIYGTDKIAVVAALNIAYDYLQLKTQNEQSTQQMRDRIRSLQDKIDTSLDDDRQLSLPTE